mmetsp:Transcript_59581/g.172567  ORF Transcript_59581/g.172567 Transcript_59581/m.172567 type:complete len:262 (-) Transcript_59581:1302-2087(-)
MGLIKHDDRIFADDGIIQNFSKQHSIGLVLDQCLWTGLVLETDRVTDLLAQTTAELLCDALRNRHGSHAPWLCTTDDSTRSIPGLGHVLSDLGRLAAAGLANDNEHLVVMDGLQQLVAQLEDRQPFPLLLDGLVRLLAEGNRLADVQLFPLGQLVGRLSEAPQGLCDSPLAGLRPWVFPWSAHVLRNGFEQTLLHGLAGFAPLFCQRCLGRGRSGQAAVGLFHHLDGRQLHARLCCLAPEEDRLALLQLDLEIFLDVAVCE